MPCGIGGLLNEKIMGNRFLIYVGFNFFKFRKYLFSVNKFLDIKMKGHLSSRLQTFGEGNYFSRLKTNHPKVLLRLQLRNWKFPKLPKIYFNEIFLLLDLFKWWANSRGPLQCHSRFMTSIFLLDMLMLIVESWKRRIVLNFRRKKVVTGVSAQWNRKTWV